MAHAEVTDVASIPPTSSADGTTLTVCCAMVRDAANKTFNRRVHRTAQVLFEGVCSLDTPGLPREDVLARLGWVVHSSIPILAITVSSGATHWWLPGLLATACTLVQARKHAIPDDDGAAGEDGAAAAAAATDTTGIRVSVVDGALTLALKCLEKVFSAFKPELRGEVRTETVEWTNGVVRALGNRPPAWVNASKMFTASAPKLRVEVRTEPAAWTSKVVCALGNTPLAGVHVETVAWARWVFLELFSDVPPGACPVPNSVLESVLRCVVATPATLSGVWYSVSVVQKVASRMCAGLSCSPGIKNEAMVVWVLRVIETGLRGPEAGRPEWQIVGRHLCRLVVWLCTTLPDFELRQAMKGALALCPESGKVAIFRELDRVGELWVRFSMLHVQHTVLTYVTLFDMGVVSLQEYCAAIVAIPLENLQIFMADDIDFNGLRQMIRGLYLRCKSMDAGQLAVSFMDIMPALDSIGAALRFSVHETRHLVAVLAEVHGSAFWNMVLLSSGIVSRLSNVEAY